MGSTMVSVTVTALAGPLALAAAGCVALALLSAGANRLINKEHYDKYKEEQNKIFKLVELSK